ncbi:MAG: carbon storage regulator [Gammaproteobacteria bacterium]|nr:carbon storage regulator [Gammaproteobacteria bacterium]MDH5651277.1 carbon storage regulator [Gammaproteobacteria bacterium]
MLTIERKEEETIILETSDGPITILVSKAQHGRVKLSIDAPKEVKISRGEHKHNTD